LVTSDKPLRYIRGNLPRFVSELRDFVRFPSVSAQPARAGDLKKCAAWLADHLKRAGLERVRVFPTKGHPIVYAEWLRAPARPTVLIYGHYDVVPAEPLEQWQSPPFEPALRGDNLYGRGASDDKGQMLAHVKALEAYLKTTRALPVNVKCLFEGEEEIGSPNLTPFIARNRRALKSDVVVMSDTPVLAPGRPAIAYALRGRLSLELEVTGPKGELHCGNYGGAVHNPLQALCELIAKLHDAHGRVAIDGFYDRVRKWSESERRYMAMSGPVDEQVLRDTKEEVGWGERGYTLYERMTIRPALSINGIVGGYQGEGMKAVIPSRAVAKLDFRLVPDQHPREIELLFRRHIARITPPTVHSSVRMITSSPPVLTSRDHPAMRAAARACLKGFGASPVFLRAGGTISVTNTFQRMLGVPTVLMGFALPDDNIHAPNEKFHLPNFFQGIETCLSFLNEASAALGDRASAERQRQALFV
jgi:acetylornithine deacetylase/succinyl-diaminopimelate desuccinylase-like protein